MSYITKWMEQLISHLRYINFNFIDLGFEIHTYIQLNFFNCLGNIVIH